MDTASAEQFFKEAAGVAKRSLCLRDKCGAIVVLSGKIVGRGYNAPPNDDVALRKCGLDLVQSPKPKSDRTCCVHAEWRAIIDAVHNAETLDGSTLFFTRVDANGNILRSGQPYCTACSRLALDNGVSFFALWHDDGIRIYDTKEYNELSYRFHRQ
jgi:deoxycytidylate deaminase